MKSIKSLFALTALLVCAAPVFAQAPAVQDTVTELVKKGSNTFVAALSKTDYLAKLVSGSYTVLPPTDAAFRDLPKAQLDALLADKDKLTGILSHHVIEGKHSIADLKAGKFKTLGGSEIAVTTVDGKVKLNGATVVRPDLPTANGVIHAIDKILQP